jgi:hypothetical protein
VRREATTDWAEAADMSRIEILEDWEAKNFTTARPIPDAPPEEVRLSVIGGRRRTSYNHVLSCEISVWHSGVFQDN